MIHTDHDEERSARIDRLVESLKRKPFVLREPAPGWVTAKQPVLVDKR